ncbi:hypothetical protein Ocin01_04918, partial [Orchesella cincta]
ITGYPQTVGVGVIQNNHWLDKIPSVEVKFKPDGITVRTGPSREDIYWIIGYIVLGIILFLLVSLAVGFCIYCICWRDQQRGSRVIVREMPVTGSSVPFSFRGSNPNMGIPQASTNMPRTHNEILIRDCLRSQAKNSSGSRSKSVNPIGTNTSHHTPPPPYRSRN